MKRFSISVICTAAILLSCSKIEDVKPFDYKLTLTQPQVENEIVHGYMQKVNYTNGDYTYSLIQPYFDSDSYTSPKKFAPRPIEISWTPNSHEYFGQKVTVTDDTGMRRDYKIQINKNKIQVFNLIPGHRYRCVLKGTNRSTFKEDSLTCITFVPEGQVRMINVPGVNNVRDMGGWKSAIYKHEDGSPKTIRYGRLYRGGELDRKITLTEEAKSILLNDLKIGSDADFRNDTECAQITTSALTGVDYMRISTSMYSASATSNTHARDFKWILERLREGKNVYYHCVAGADRTGTMGYLLEGILGVSENDQCKDWELTCFYSWRSRVYGEKYDFGTMVKTYYEKFKGSTTAENCVAYFKKYGITDEELDEFREIMLE